MGGAGRAEPGPAGSGAGRRALRDRAQDRRPGHLAGVRGRGARPRRHPGQRRDRRAGDPEPAHHPRDPAADRRRAAAARGARRDLPAAGRLRHAQRAAGGGRGAHLRQPAEHRGGLDPPARSSARRRAAAVDLVLRDRRGRGARVPHPPRVAGVAARARLPGQPGDRGLRHRRGGRGRLQGVGDAPRPARLRDRRRGGQGRRPGPAAAAGGGGPRAARRHRLEVRSHHGAYHHAEGGLERGPHRAHGALRPAGAGAGLRGHGQAGHPAQ